MNELNQVTATVADIQKQIADLQKAIATSDTAFPVRENLAAEAKVMIPVDTPLLNRFPQVPGAGKAAAWKEITSFGSTPTGDNVFYAEGGAPSSRTTVYADRSETYKQVGLDGGVSGLAISAGANFQDQLAAEKRNTLLHLKRLEETAIINGSGTGNAFSGLRTQITSANGCYVAAASGTAASAVLGDVDQFIQQTWDKGADLSFFLVTSAGARRLSDAIVKSNATSLQVNVNTQAGIAGGFFVNRYISPINGQQVDIVPDKFHTNSELLGICESLPTHIPGQGGNGVELDVLMDYAMADVPTANDQKLFRILRYYVLKLPGRRFCGVITSWS